jgi:hypothetical protein
MSSKATLIQTALNAGEFSPRMDGRVDIDKYRAALSRLENCVLYPHGAAASRPGTKYIAETKVGDEPSRLIPFIYSTVQAYIIEFGYGYLRFFKDEGQIADPVTPTIPYEIVSPYVSGLSAIQYRQSADVLYLAHSSYAQRKLIRYDHDSWTISQILFEDGPYLAENSDGTTHLHVSATTGTGVTVKARYRYGDLDTGTYDGTLSAPDVFLTVAAPFGVVLFEASAGEILSVKINITTASGVASVATAYIYASDGTKATGAVLATSDTQSVSSTGEKTFTFTSAPEMVGGDWYAIVFGVDVPDAAIRADTVTNDAGYVSGYAAAATGALTPLAGGNEYRVEINYQPTGPAAIFHAGHVGSLWRLRHSGQEQTELFDTVGDSTTPIKLRGKFYVDVATITPDTSIGEEWFVGRIVLQKSYTQRTWYDVASFHYSTKQEFFENQPDVYYRLYFETRKDGKADVTIAQEEHWGTLKITSVTTTSSAVADVLFDIGSTSPTPLWREGAWSDYRGFPGALMFDGDRLVFGGTDHQPYTIWASWVGDYENFTPGDTDDAAYTFTLSKLSNRICWMESDDNPIIGTLGEEARLVSIKQAPISQSNPPEVMIQSRRGSARSVPAVPVGSNLLFLDRSKRKLLEIAYDLQSDKMVPLDLTLFSEHVTSSGIEEIAYQSNPDSIVWCRQTSGLMLGLTYYRAENVVGWHRFNTDGLVRSVACIPSSLGEYAGYDQLWMIVQREIDGVTKRFVELMANNESVHSLYTKAYQDLIDIYELPDTPSRTFAIAAAKVILRNHQQQLFHVDCGAIYDGAAATTITGLDHLEGKDVSVLADGIVVEGLTVSGGSITLETAASYVIVGLPFTARISTMRIEAGSQMGTSQGKTKKISRVQVRVLNSLGGKYFAVPTDIRNIPSWKPGDTQFDLSTLLFTGDIDISWSGDWEREGKIHLMQDQPLPLTVLAIIPTVNVSRD